MHDPYPESRSFTNIKLYNHLVLHNSAGRWCSIDCMTKKFEGRSSEGNGRQCGVIIGVSTLRE
jgi:hypothetical protein